MYSYTTNVYVVVLFSLKIKPLFVYLWQADRGFARSRLCTNKDGNTNNLVLYTVRNGTSKKGGNAPGLRIKREREEYVGN